MKITPLIPEFAETLIPGDCESIVGKYRHILAWFLHCYQDICYLPQLEEVDELLVLNSKLYL